ncbi:GGDEF domain-containing protein [Henriciella sp. AS95]|uniref:GGDEF domain-containing protein n=1 Tax=Henriciella sp. AS95 TaxID=3135782 RepID=UPI003181B8DF
MALIGLAVPGLAGCLTAIFVGFWYYNREFRAPIWIALAFALSAIGFCFSNFLLGKDTMANAILNNAIYGVGNIVLFHGICQAFNRRTPWGVLSALALATVVAAVAIQATGIGLNYRILVTNITLGLMHAYGLFHLRSIWREHWTGSAVVIAITLSTLNFMMISPLTTFGPEITGDSFFASAYWLSMNVVTILSIISVAGALISVCVSHNLQRIHDDANQDFLTGLQTRGAFERAAQFYSSRRSGRSAASLILIDIDHFKSINDTFGHASGDAVISAIGRLIGGQVRRSDIAGRVGGEEFCLLLPGTDVSGAKRLAARLKSHMRDLAFPEIGTDQRVTVSFGIAEFGQSSAFHEIYAEADAMLYFAKQRGRDRIVCAERPIDAGTPIRRESLIVPSPARTA